MVEACDHPITVEAELEQTFVKVEQVAVLVPLKQRSQLRAKDFLRLERDNLRLGLMPTTADLEWVGLQTVEILMLARVYLYLELELATISLRIEPEYQVHRVSNLLPLGFSEPGECLA